ncbi:sensor histidine kinase [Streptosporangium sp. NPDC000396]|uniref:sensor histidine kinase n=1 Tax=Streptosporangium sp. NPDC000396 TaxID=3366185 RepID=UPI0036884B92
MGAKQGDPGLEMSGIEAMGARVAESLELRRSEVLSVYEAQLREANSTIVMNDASWGQALEQAGYILEDVKESLRSGQAVIDQSTLSLSTAIGVSRASHGVHTSDSLRAAAILFEVILTVVEESLPDDAVAARVLSVAATALNLSLVERVQSAAMSYAGHLLNRIHGAHVDERRRIARELHDRLGNQVNVAFRHLEMHEIYHTGSPSEKVTLAKAALVECLDRIRDINLDLRLRNPVEDLEKGLLEYLALVAPNDVSTTVFVNGDEAWAPAGVRDELFVVLREALRNALTHAEPRNLTAWVDIAPHEVRAMIEDDGKGFDVTTATRSGNGIGLTSMKERTELLGGTVSVHSRPGAGARIQVRIPLPGVRDVKYS